MPCVYVPSRGDGSRTHHFALVRPTASCRNSTACLEPESWPRLRCAIASTRAPLGAATVSRSVRPSMGRRTSQRLDGLEVRESARVAWLALCNPPGLEHHEFVTTGVRPHVLSPLMRAPMSALS